MSEDKYDKTFFKVGMILLYMPGMRGDVVGTINIITDIRGNDIFTRRWNSVYNKHEGGNFETPIKKHLIKIIGDV